MLGWTCFEIGINFLQAVMMVYFVRRKLHLIHWEMRYAAVTTLCIAGYLTLYLFLEVPIPDTVVFLFPIGYALWASDEPWYVKLFWGIALTAAFIGTIQLMANLMLMMAKSSWETMMAETPLRMLFVISTNLALLIVIFLLSRRNQSSVTLSWGAVTVFVVLEALNLLVVEIAFTIRMTVAQADALFMILSGCTLLCALLSLLLYEIMTALAEKKRAYEVEIETLRLTQHHTDEMKDMYTYMVGQQHDLKKQIDILRRMIAAGHMVESETFLQQLSLDKPTPLEFITGNVAVDALLTSKKLTMDKVDIHFTLQPYPLHELPLPESEFCAILSNLLDNAIEAIGRMSSQNENRTIRLTLARSWNIFFITCQNAADPKTLRQRGQSFLTSKSHGLKHGHGLQNIRSIVERRQGKFACGFENGLFTAEVMLKLD